MGSSQADALSISGFAFSQKAPIILVNQDSEITNNALERLASSQFKNIIVIGGENAVHESTIDAIKNTCYEVLIQRYWGENRYETSSEIAKFCLDNEYFGDGACIATGTDFPDALAGGILVGGRQTILLLADSNNDLSLNVLALANKKEELNGISFLGGNQAVSNDIRFNALNQAGLL